MDDFKLTPPVADAQGQADSDHYPTPPLLAQAGVDMAVELYGERPKMLIEPGCSERAPFVAAARRLEIEACGIELRDVAEHAWIKPGLNYLAGGQPRRIARGADIIITNPPFSLAVEFITQAMEDISDRGLVVMLLQTGIEGSAARRTFWNVYQPVFRYVVRPRPGFVKGGNDSREYAFYVWVSPAFALHLRAMGRNWTETRFLDNEGTWGRAEQ